MAIKTLKLSKAPLKKPLPSGFSLTELMVVVMVMFAILAMTAPSIQTWTSTSLSMGARQLDAFLNLSRAEAIRTNRVVRVALVRGWSEEPESVLRKLSAWSWDDRTDEFVQVSEWQVMPEGIIIEPEFPHYVRHSAYAEDDGTVVNAHFPDKKRTFDINGERVEVLTIDFMPSGRVRMSDSGSKRMIGFVLVQGYPGRNGEIVRTSPENFPGRPANWAQVNVDTLTGRVQVHRP